MWLNARRVLLGALDAEGLLKWDETSLDGSFAPAKKGATRSVALIMKHALAASLGCSFETNFNIEKQAQRNTMSYIQITNYRKTFIRKLVQRSIEPERTRSDSYFASDSEGVSPAHVPMQFDAQLPRAADRAWRRSRPLLPIV